MALQIGWPVVRSHTTVVSRWFVMPMAAMSVAMTFAFVSASAATPDCVAQISCGSCSTQPGFGKDLPELLLRHRDDGAGVIEDDGPRAGRALVEREDVFHGAPHELIPQRAEHAPNGPGR